MTTRNEHDELSPLPPTLASIPKVDPFVVPEGLFERLPHQVQARVTGQRYVPTWSPWVKRLAFTLPLLAMLAGIWWMLRSPETPVEQAAVEIPETTFDELELFDDPAFYTELLETEEATLANADVDLTEDELAAWLELEQTDLTQMITEL
jgi:hypothetical protein